MFMILPAARIDSKAQPLGNEEPAEETRARVRKACNRCRVKKSKCNGRIPCARCERDKVACKADRGPVDRKLLARNYMASLEEQHAYLLNALRELKVRAPNDAAVRGVLDQLQANGFDINAMEGPSQPLAENTSTSIPQNVEEPSSMAFWNNGSFSIDPAGLNDLQTLLENAGALQPSTMSGPLWNLDNSTLQLDPQDFPSNDTAFLDQLPPIDSDLTNTNQFTSNDTHWEL